MFKKALTVTATAAFILAGSTFGLARAETIAYHGNWETLVEDDGIGVMTTFNDGSTFTLALVDSELHLLIRDPDWDLTRGLRVPITIDVDHDDYFRGMAIAINHTTLDLTVADMNFVNDFIHGYGATLTVFEEDWQIDLTGSALATEEMFNRILD